MRKWKNVTIEAEGRDQGKTFRITELSAFKAEKWAGRALIALISSGASIPDSVAKAGMAGVAAMGVQALTTASGIQWNAIEPLLDEMMGCVQFIPSMDRPNVMLPWTTVVNTDQVEEVQTLLTLRKEVLELHLGFSLADKLKSLSLSETEPATSVAQTSQPASPPSSSED